MNTHVCPWLRIYAARYLWTSNRLQYISLTNGALAPYKRRAPSKPRVTTHRSHIFAMVVKRRCIGSPRLSNTRFFVSHISYLRVFRYEELCLASERCPQSTCVALFLAWNTYSKARVTSPCTLARSSTSTSRLRSRRSLRGLSPISSSPPPPRSTSCGPLRPLSTAFCAPLATCLLFSSSWSAERSLFFSRRRRRRGGTADSASELSGDALLGAVLLVLARGDCSRAGVCSSRSEAATEAGRDWERAGCCDIMVRYCIYGL